MFVDFFIRRPVFAIVCSLVIVLLGTVSIPTLPIEQYPDISPVQIVVSANYIGASAEVVEETVTSVLERQINGVEGMKYMTSTSVNDGSSTIKVIFKQGYDKDNAVVNVQNRVKIAEPQLPDAVQQTGVSITKQSNSSVLAVALYSENDVYDDTFLSNYADLYILDILKRIEGVADIRVYGERRYAMRLWLDPNRLASRGLTAQDVIDALKKQNLQVSVGRIGQPPAFDGQKYQIDILAQGRLKKATQFENIVLKRGLDGTLIKLKDVGRAELGSENYSSFARYSGRNAVAFEVLQLPGSNALSIAKAVKNEIVQLAKSFPSGMKYEIPYDPTIFVVESGKEVVKTLLESIILVIIVIFIFLQSWQTTLIPAITIPVSLIGTFAFVKVFGFSLNSLTLFGLTLATGMVVDDAIVVVENVTTLIQTQGMKPRHATSAAMTELTGALIATSLVLMAVFIPVAFFPGSAGMLYKQFALTIAFSIAISTFNALTLTPALSALLLQGQQPKGWLGLIFERTNCIFDLTREGYQRLLLRVTRFKEIVLALFIASLGLTSWLYLHVPTAFLPDEDQGFLINLVQGPEGASLEYTSQVFNQVDKEVLKLPEVQGTFSLGGSSFSGSTANNGIAFVPLKFWSERKQADQTASAILNKIREPLSKITDARIISINPPTIQGLANVGGFVFQLQDRGNGSLENLVKIRDELIQRANQLPELQSVFSTFAANSPQLLLEIDRDKAEALQVSVDDILSTLQIFIGSRYVNNFNDFGRNYRVYVQADRQFRSNPDDIGKLYVRSAQGSMIPLSNLVKVTSTTGPQTINHYNMFRSIEINGAAAPGFSSGQAIQAMEKLASEILPSNIGYEWSGISLEELSSTNQAPLIFGLGIIFVFLVLAAQYNNFVDPLILLLAVPLAILGALLAQSLRGLSNDIYCQVGLVMLIGLASKNAILIVEFANQLHDKGLSIYKAVIQAAQQRLRPIVMTALSTLLGIWPLAVAEGAGAVSRQSLGTAVFGGMLVATFLSLFVIPVLYVIIKTLYKTLSRDLVKSD
ncbi:MAG: hydrophobe/amphiphile efflux-1 family RND transporter [Hapalosiphonaceae cyanobacterium JJU2]|nr:MAG: hydrophobe/amphiphile efflux-1 family RND transporter [Hapalosiphonaceae cyanobacterium JJU2]